MEVPKTLSARNLLDLPDEVLLNVFDKVAEQNPWNGTALLSLRQTCRRVEAMTEPFVYRARRIRTGGDYDWLISDLKADSDKRRQSYVQDLVVANEDQVYDGLPKERAMTRLAFRFPNIKYLEFRTDFLELEDLEYWNTEMWVKHWNRGISISTNRFTNLTECYLRVDPERGDPCPRMQLAPLLQAPKLKNLTLEGADLTMIPKDFVPDHSTVLEHLKLRRCLFDENSFSIILSKPRGLTSVDFGDKRSDVKKGNDYHSGNSRWYPPQEELQMIQLMLQAVTRFQPGLTALRFTLENQALLDSEAFSGALDFTRLKKLKELHVKKSDWNEHHYGSRVWCPTNLFVNLPASVETIGLRTRVGGVALEKLADFLLDPRRNPDGLPKSLRQLYLLTRFTYEELQRPLTMYRQQSEDNLRQSINRLMTGTTLSRLQYSQCTLHLLRSHPKNFDINSPLYWIRELRATLSTTPGDIQSSDTEKNTYDLEELTWVQDRLLIRGRKPAQLERKTWGPEEWKSVLKTKDSSRRIVSTSLTTGLKPEQEIEGKESDDDSVYDFIP